MLACKARKPWIGKLKVVLLAPFWAVQLLTGAKSFLDNPLIGSQYRNKRGLHLRRVRLAAALCDGQRRRLAQKVQPEWREAFDRDGYVAISNIVPPEEFPAFRKALLSYQGEAREMRQGDAVTRRMAIDPVMLEAIPALRHLLERKDVVRCFAMSPVSVPRRCIMCRQL